VSKNKGFTNDAIPALSVCESPIEGKFVQAFFDTMRRDGCVASYLPQTDVAKISVVFLFQGDDETTTKYILSVSVSPFWLGGKRVDMTLQVQTNVAKVNLAIELDGSQFHNTDEQRGNDRKKDRAMAANGFVPIRFSGKEVYADPDGVVHETLRIAFGSLSHIESHYWSGNRDGYYSAKPDAEQM
jgi:hypothetical protein